MAQSLGAFVGAILVFAGLTKIGSTRQFSDFAAAVVGVSHVPAVFGAVGIAAEIGLGGALLVGAFPLLAAVGASLLGIGFVVAHLVSLQREMPSCRCFGSLGENDPVSIETLRAAVLALVALGVIASIVSAGDEHILYRTPSSLSLLGIALATAFLLGSALVSGVMSFNASRPHVIPRRYSSRLTAQVGITERG